MTAYIALPDLGAPEPLAEQLTRERQLRAQAEARVAELELRVAESQFRAERYYSWLSALMENLQLGLLLMDREGRVGLVNDQYCSLLQVNRWEIPIGMPSAEGLGMALLVKDKFSDPDDFLRRTRATREGDRTVLNESFTLTDGRVLERDYILLSNAYSGWLVCYRDVTERHHQTQLRLLSLLPEQNPNPVMRLMPTGEVVYANPAAAHIFQAYIANEAPELRSRLQALVNAAPDGPRHQQQEITLADRHYLLTVATVPGELYVTLYLTDITARHKAERQLIEQQEFYESILAELPTAVSVFDADHRYLYVNPTVEPDPAEREWLIGKTSFESCVHRQRPSATAEKRQALFEQAVRERREVVWEETVDSNQGRRHWLRRFRPLFHPDGSPRMAVSSGVDIAERKQAEERLVQQRGFYEAILNLLPLDVVVFDAQHRFVFVNPSAIADPAVRKQVIGMTNMEYCAFRQSSTAMAAQREQYFAQAVHERADVSWEETFARPEGSQQIVRRMRPVFEADGNLRMVVSMGLDITARNQAEEQRRRSDSLVSEQQEFIRQVVNTLPNYLYVNDKAGNLVFSNCAFQELAFRSSHFRTPLPENDPEAAELRQLSAWNEQVLHTRQDIVAETDFTLNNGEVLQLQVVKRPLVRPDGSVEVLTITTDITEFKQARREAEAALRARESFLANMSHEIRTPMNGVLGMAGLLARTELNSQQLDYLNIIKNSGTHLLGVLNDVLDVAKITSSKLELEYIPFDLNETLQTVAQTLAFRATEKGIHFTTLPAQLAHPVVVSDPQRLSQVLLNLLSNSIKFTERGSITLTATWQAETAATVAVRFLVSDTGLGVPLDKQEVIFSSFAQAYPDTTRRFGGTGLGLTISSSLVEQLGGHLLMCSEPGRGSTFGFTLTLAKALQGTATEQARRTDAAAVHALLDAEAVRGIRVLLVEDHAVNLQLARLVLENHGVLIDAAVDGASALRLFEQARYDLVLMDIQMPGMSGLEATAAIRRHPDAARAKTPIIALTANAFLTDNEKYLAAGMDDYLAKPFDEAVLLRKMTTLYQASTRSTPPLFDLRELHQMAHGNTEFVPRILDLFLLHTPPILAELQVAVADSDWDQAAQVAHKLKSSLKVLHVDEVLASIDVLEQPHSTSHARVGAAQQVAQVLPKLFSQIEDCIRATRAS